MTNENKMKIEQIGLIVAIITLALAIYQVPITGVIIAQPSQTQQVRLPLELDRGLGVLYIINK